MKSQPEDRLPGSQGGVAREREGMARESLAHSLPIPSSAATLDAGAGRGGLELGAGGRTSGKEHCPPREGTSVSTGPCKTGGSQEQDPRWTHRVAGCGFKHGSPPCTQDSVVQREKGRDLTFSRHLLCARGPTSPWLKCLPRTPHTV